MNETFSAPIITDHFCRRGGMGGHPADQCSHDPNITVAPIYTISSPDDATALAQGKTVIKLGPCLFGLYPGAMAFKSQTEAKDFIGLKGYDPKKWRIFQLSGDYQLDVTEGVLNKTLQLSRDMTINDTQ
ncbi:hypothetical protein [uncultured Tolumonas sp.]|uniref:hypothetical protein n=1 Tax=uncultured Tolumonas sp. TaxID=263765 RepID=UPI002A0A7A3C|nr:hypothetical protein [uncultured Tolumonas sp.]